MRHTLSSYQQLMRIHQPIGFFLLLWPSLTALWLASGGHPRPVHVLIFICGAFLCRSAGCVLNDITDRQVDRLVSRTKNRVLALGLLSTTQAYVLAGGLLCGAAVLTISFSRESLVLVAAAGIGLGIYPYAKYFFVLPQCVLGPTFSIGILIAYSIYDQLHTVTAWLLYGGNVLWVIAYDTQYALTDKQDDHKVGIHSSALFFTPRQVVWVIGLCYAGFLGLWALCVPQHEYMLDILLGGAAVLCAYNTYLATGNGESNFRAFLNNHWVGLLLFLAVLTHPAAPTVH